MAEYTIRFFSLFCVLLGTLEHPGVRASYSVYYKKWVSQPKTTKNEGLPTLPTNKTSYDTHDTWGTTSHLFKHPSQPFPQTLQPSVLLFS